MENEELNLAEMKAKLVVAYEQELCIDDAIVIHTTVGSPGDNTFVVNNEKAHALCRSAQIQRGLRRFVVFDQVMNIVFDDEATVDRINHAGRSGQLFVVVLAKKKPVLDMRDRGKFHLRDLSRGGFAGHEAKAIVEFDVHACKKTTEEVLAAYEGRTVIDVMVCGGEKIFRFDNALITEYTLERDEDGRGRDTLTITLRAASVEVSPS